MNCCPCDTAEMCDLLGDGIVCVVKGGSVSDDYSLMDAARAGNFVILRSDLDFFVIGLADGNIVCIPILRQQRLLTFLSLLFTAGNLKRVLIARRSVLVYLEGKRCDGRHTFEEVLIEAKDFYAGSACVGAYALCPSNGCWYVMGRSEGEP